MRFRRGFREDGLRRHREWPDAQVQYVRVRDGVEGSTASVRVGSGDVRAGEGALTDRKLPTLDSRFNARSSGDETCIRAEGQRDDDTGMRADVPTFLEGHAVEQPDVGLVPERSGIHAAHPNRAPIPGYRQRGDHLRKLR